MKMNRRLAIIVPVRDGGDYLGRSVSSIGTSDLTGEDAEILVLDNQSGDGAPDTLPAEIGRHVPVRLIRNQRDLGRVGNWNRGVEMAKAGGFEFATFLFAGDTWLPGSAVLHLLDEMISGGADLGLAPFRIVGEDGQIVRSSPRVSLSCPSKTINSLRFFQLAMTRGHLPVTPLQANIYRIQTGRPLRFDPNRPLTTDMYATIDFLAGKHGKIAVSSRPFCVWLARKGRVYCTAGLRSFMEDHFEQLRYAAEQSGCELNWTRAKSVFLLTYLRSAFDFRAHGSAHGSEQGPAQESMTHILDQACRQAATLPGRFDFIDMLSLTVEKYLFGRSVLHLT